MRLVQRVVLTLLAVVLLLFGMVVVYHGKEKKFQNQWEDIQSERFLETICRTGQLSLEEYCRYCSDLNYGTPGLQITIEEYQKEQDKEGTWYYYLISWEELQEILWKQENRRFPQESIIKISIESQTRWEKRKKDYYGMVLRKAENDT